MGFLVKPQELHCCPSLVEVWQQVMRVPFHHCLMFQETGCKAKGQVTGCIDHLIRNQDVSFHLTEEGAKINQTTDKNAQIDDSRIGALVKDNPILISLLQPGKETGESQV